MKRAILFIFSTVLITASCSKESEKSNNFSSRLKSSERLFTDAQIAEIGEKHNEIAFEVYESVDFEDYSASLQSNLMDVDLGEGYNEHKSDIYNAAYDVDYTNLDQYANQNVVAYYEMAFSSLENQPDLESIIEKFDELEAQARDELTGTDLDQVLIMLSVGRNSAYFWLPASKGGNGLGYSKLAYLTSKNVDPNSSNKKSTKEISRGVREAIGKDMIGGLGSAVGWGIGVLAFGGPVGVGAYVFTVAWGAATSSLL
ncbi:MAG: hypothetical protein CMI36_14760 [Owenweeksia sp.]|nr:hypothetical protein [Owenweeksia sp.]MBG00252.1 hypothetical protein [Owenweeksia sp.]HBF19246.1 hypothetical protein [Cryomorphaceae bacterium]|tara:strand:- start:415 stop:1185 length:771 start_codon:yes stop_codon:yes gene_type:complete